MNETQRLLVKQSIEALRPHTDELCDRFYQALFAAHPQLEGLFSNSPVARRTKFNGMMAAFDSVKYLDKIAPALEALGRRHVQYGVRPDDYPFAIEAFLTAVHSIRGADLVPGEGGAWRELFSALVPLMGGKTEHRDRASYEDVDRRLRPGESVVAAGMLEAVGGREVIERIHRRFYFGIFEDEWLGRFFFGKSEEALIKKQTDFVVACFGGPNEYRGEPPGIAHMHMLITDEQFDLREQMMRKAILAEGLSEELADRWLAVESAFRPAIVKGSVEECVTRCIGQVPIVVRKPQGYRWEP